MSYDDLRTLSPSGGRESAILGKNAFSKIGDIENIDP